MWARHTNAATCHPWSAPGSVARVCNMRAYILTAWSLFAFFSRCICRNSQLSTLIAAALHATLIAIVRWSIVWF